MTARPHATVALTGVTRRYGSTRALDGVDLTMTTGVTGLLGPNGAGKTTLLRMLATVLAPTDGRLRLLGLDPSDPAERTDVRRSLGYLPQEMGFPSGFSAFRFVDYMAVLKEWTDKDARHDEVRRVLDLVGLRDLATKRLRTLSGGQRRRAALAQALIGDPRLLVLDEPTTGLDPEQRASLRGVLSAAGNDATVVLATHQTEDVAALCERVIVVDGGQVRWDGTVQRPGRDRAGPGLARRRPDARCAVVVAHRHRPAPQRRNRRTAGRRAGGADGRGRLPAAARRPRGRRRSAEVAA